jgi:hypothetical protein
VVAGLQPAAAMLVERGCTATAAAVVGDCPRTVAEGGAAVPWMGCRSCGTSEEQR